MLLKGNVWIYLMVHFIRVLCEKNCTIIPDKCPRTKYRSFDGSCNNLKHPGWGMSKIRFRRILPPEYGDGISSYRKSKSGKELPNARKISQTVFPDVSIKDPNYTLLLMQYGQMVTHDMAMIGIDELAQNFCCTEDLQFLNKTEEPPNCAPIHIPSDDPYYSKYNAKCISFARISSDRDLNCSRKHKPIEQISFVNSYFDLSMIYGSETNINNHVRLNKSGLLRTRKDKGQEWLLKSENITADCVLSPKNETCFYTSDVRLNQTPQLALLHIIFYREHNRLAKALARINSHWDDNRLFEEARRINIAQHEWISYYEWLPLMMNKTKLLQSKIIYTSKGYINDYNPEVDPGISSEHNNAAFRLHTQIAGRLDLVEESRHCPMDNSLRISDWYWRPSVLEDKNAFTKLARGLTTQFSWASDRYHDHEITHFWFRRGPLGYDLKATDIQRSRDTGIATYNNARAFCNLSVAKTFNDLIDVPESIRKTLSQLYETPDDLDLIVAGTVENLVPGALVGPTFHCIITEQFLRSRIADRFWFEHKEAGFTLDQLNEIRSKTRMSRLMCDNTKDVKLMQLKAFEKIDSGNPLKSCKELPTVDLSKWKD